MGRFVNPDNSAFRVITNSEIYVDKTKLIEYTNRAINTDRAMICNSRSRRFGKSITANIFDGLKAAIIMMMSGERVKVRTRSYQNDMVTFKNKDDVMTSLIHLGYLAYNQIQQTAYIPNEEMATIIRHWWLN